jgi:hypothetical protein
MLVGNSAVLLQMNADHSDNLGTALQHLTAKPLGSVIVVLFALVLATMLIQAFEFEAIRLLEGYIVPRLQPFRTIVHRRIRRNARRRERLNRQIERARRRALSRARSRAAAAQAHEDVLLYLRIIYFDQVEKAVPKKYKKVAPAALSLKWRQFVDASTLHRLDTLAIQFRHWPAPHRIMPTKLGNTLRAAEDRVADATGGNLQSFVIRHLDQMPATLRREHDEHRTRLDLYCSLTLVFCVLPLISIGTLIEFSPIWLQVSVVASYFGLAVASYNAAVASARGYGEALEEISRTLGKK